MTEEKTSCGSAVGSVHACQSSTHEGLEQRNSVLAA